MMHYPLSFKDNKETLGLLTASPSFLLAPNCYQPPQVPHKDSSSLSNFSNDQEELDDEKLLSESKKIRKNSGKRDKYNVISNEIRLELIDAVINKGEKIKRAASRLGVNYSSAKSIFQVYKREGRADKKISKKNKLRQDTNQMEDKYDNPSFSLDCQESIMMQQAGDALNAGYGNPFKALIDQNPLLMLDNLRDITNYNALRIQKSGSVPNLFGLQKLSLQKNFSMTSEVNQMIDLGFDLVKPLTFPSKSTPTQSFSANNSAFSMFSKSKKSESLSQVNRLGTDGETDSNGSTSQGEGSEKQL